MLELPFVTPVTFVTLVLPSDVLLVGVLVVFAVLLVSVADPVDVVFVPVPELV
ncbi:hypothetical protein GCM10025858_20340 [Alicyclobacillus sacchari]|nr:hypothetical protein GCM10025858_20340 [Alicyclobacillus sacchari]